MRTWSTGEIRTPKYVDGERDSDMCRIEINAIGDGHNHHHKNIKTTLMYTHVAATTVANIRSPLGA